MGGGIRAAGLADELGRSLVRNEGRAASEHQPLIRLHSIHNRSKHLLPIREQGGHLIRAHPPPSLNVSPSPLALHFTRSRPQEGRNLRRRSNSNALALNLISLPTLRGRTELTSSPVRSLPIIQPPADLRVPVARWGVGCRSPPTFIQPLCGGLCRREQMVRSLPTRSEERDDKLRALNGSRAPLRNTPCQGRSASERGSCTQLFKVPNGAQN